MVGAESVAVASWATSAGQAGSRSRRCRSRQLQAGRSARAVRADRSRSMSSRSSISRCGERLPGIGGGGQFRPVRPGRPVRRTRRRRPGSARVSVNGAARSTASLAAVPRGRSVSAGVSPPIASSWIRDTTADRRIDVADAGTSERRARSARPDDSPRSPARTPRHGVESPRPVAPAGRSGRWRSSGRLPPRPPSQRGRLPLRPSSHAIGWSRLLDRRRASPRRWICRCRIVVISLDAGISTARPAIAIAAASVSNRRRTVSGIDDGTRLSVPMRTLAVRRAEIIAEVTCRGTPSAAASRSTARSVREPSKQIEHPGRARVRQADDDRARRDRCRV